MASNGVVRTKKPDFNKQCLFYVGLLIISAVFVRNDEAAAEERKREMVLSMQQAFSRCLDVVAGGLARGLNVLLHYVTHFLQAAGIQVGLPVYPVTPEGVIFVSQWVLLLLIGYGVIYVAFQLVTFFLRWLCWLLKVGVAFACFGLILNEKETMAIRLVCIGYICILLGIQMWKDHTMAARIVYLEEQVKVLENNVRKMKIWRRRCMILSCCLIGLVSFVVLILFGVYTILSNSNA